MFNYLKLLLTMNHVNERDITNPEIGAIIIGFPTASLGQCTPLTFSPLECYGASPAGRLVGVSCELKSDNQPSSKAVILGSIVLAKQTITTNDS